VLEIGFFALAPALHYPLEFDQSIKLIEIGFPVLLGYLGSAAYFVVTTPTRGARRKPVLLSPEFTLLVRGPTIIFVLATAAVIVGFGLSNSPQAPPGQGMSFETLSAMLSLVLGILTATTTVISTHLFGSEKHDAGIIVSQERKGGT
jgi:hypothetical protein